MDDFRAEVHRAQRTNEWDRVAFWLMRYGIDEKHAVDVTLTGGYWYWTAGSWLVLYVFVYWVPRFA